jgi:hypothetical protein
MSPARRFPPPWTIEEANDACLIVRDSTGQAAGRPSPVNPLVVPFVFS